MDPSSLFDAYYFEHQCGQPYRRTQDWLDLFEKFAAHICAGIAPASVLDAGCAIGLLVEALRQRGVDAWGVDISEYAIRQAAPDVQPFVQVASVTQPFPRRYDLIVCIEVLEHLPPPDSEAALANLCRHTDDILFSSTPNNYHDVSHLNVQPPEYWAEQFARHGFHRDVDFDASFITPWAARFRRRADPFPRLVRDYERRFGQLWKENTDLRHLSLEMRERLAYLESEVQRLQKAAQEHQGAREDAERRLAALQTQLDALQTSRTWRWGQALSRFLRLKTPPK